MRYSDEIVAIVPARSGSVSVKDKNIKDLCGFPLMTYSIAAAQMCKEISRIIVSTDSEKYAKIAVKYGAEVPFLRPDFISGSKAEDIEYLRHALLELAKVEGRVPKWIVLLRPTTPLRDTWIIQEALNKMRLFECTSVVSVIKNTECPYKWVKVDKNGQMSSLFAHMSVDDVNKPRQSFPETFYPDGAVEVLSARTILEDGEMYGDCALSIIKDKTVDIDTEEEFEMAKKLIKTTEIYDFLINNHEKNHFD